MSEGNIVIQREVIDKLLEMAKPDLYNGQYNWYIEGSFEGYHDEQFKKDWDEWIKLKNELDNDL